MSLHPFEQLTPHFILDAVESTGFFSDARIYPLNSYENRVYQVGIEDSTPIIAKFYRPNRWSNEQLQEEHDILLELKKANVSVAAPIEFGGKTLLTHKEFQFCLYDKIQGQSPDADNMDHLFRTGELIGEVHNTIQSVSLQQRNTLAPLTTIKEASNKIFNSSLMHKKFHPIYKDLIADISERATNAISIHWPKTLQPIHGDCHRSNLLLQNDQLTLLDFDDCIIGPQVQDIWPHLSGDLPMQRQQLSELIEGYETFQPFDSTQLALIDPLKVMRIIQYSAWLHERWEDPAFPKAFPWFASEDYWATHLSQLKESLTQWGELAK